MQESSTFVHAPPPPCPPQGIDDDDTIMMENYNNTGTEPHSTLINKQQDDFLMQKQQPSSKLQESSGHPHLPPKTTTATATTATTTTNVPVSLSVQALDDAMKMLLTENTDASASACIVTLMKLLDNVLHTPLDAKVRSIRLQNSGAFYDKGGSSTRWYRVFASLRLYRLVIVVITIIAS
jgi:PUB domain